MGYWITTEHQQRDLTLEAEILTSLVAEGEVSKEWASHLSQAIEGGKIRGDVYISEEENEEGTYPSLGKR